MILMFDSRLIRFGVVSASSLSNHRKQMNWQKSNFLSDQPARIQTSRIQNRRIQNR